ncbi:hypothetical protein, partial [Streptomyces sp. NPDC059389]|uniref:hypothetical protein n=1 Tax=Streptomyces sp. NPDC059389 TaxID=3346818 RepID=UPI00369D4EC6
AWMPGRTRQPPPTQRPAGSRSRTSWCVIVLMRTGEETAAYACVIVRKPAAAVFQAFADPAVTA